MFHDAVRLANPRTITVDIFDTVLLRKTYPEELQFLKHAKLVSRILNARWKTEIRPFAFYSFRQYVRRILGDVQYARTGERETRIREIFAETLECIAQNASVAMSPEERTALVETLVEEELLMEHRSLRVNRRVVAALRTCKMQGLKVYFVSDMYLETDDIMDLLKHFGCADVFDGGISSASAGCSKGSGKLFDLLPNLLPGFEPALNLHIGDDPHADFAVPRRAGMRAFRLRTIHTRILRPFLRSIGTWQRKFTLRMQKIIICRSLARSARACRKNLPEKEAALHGIGTLLGPAVLAHLAYVDLYARRAKRPVFFISSEAPTLARLSTLLGSRNTLRQVPDFNRLQALRQFLYLGLTKTDLRDATAILWVALLGETYLSASGVLQRMGIDPEELSLPQTLYDELPAFAHMQGIAQLLREEPRLMRSLREAHEQARAALEEAGFFAEREVLLADVGWNGTIQSLLTLTAALMEHTMDIRGIYLGCTGLPLFPGDVERMHGVLFSHVHHPLAEKLLIEEIWEYALCKTEENDHSRELILRGMETVFHAHRADMHAAPDFLLECSYPRLTKLFCRPERAQVAALAHIPNEMRLGSEPTRPIVDLSYSQGWVLHNLFRYPLRFRNLCAAQFWQNGFISWYRLRPFLPLIACQQLMLRFTHRHSPAPERRLSLQSNKLSTERQHQRMAGIPQVVRTGQPKAPAVVSSPATAPRSK